MSVPSLLFRWSSLLPDIRLSIWAWILGAAHRCRRRPGLGRARRRFSAGRRLVCVSSRDIWTQAPGQLAQLSLRLAALLHRTALHRFRLHRPLRFSRGLLARPSISAHRRAALASLRQLRRRRCLPACHRAALSQHQLRRANGLGAFRGRHGRHRRSYRLWLRSRCSQRRLAHARRAALSPLARLGGLAQATLLATYCYWGYYNICFLGGEVRRPERTIPRAILLSVALRLRVLYRS